jgi:dolichol kinase
MANEIGRQAVHAAAGIAAIAIGVVAGRQMLVAILLTALAATLSLAHLKLSFKRLHALDAILAKLERKDAAFPFAGAVSYAVGTLMLATAAQDYAFALAAIAILAVADSVSTVVGNRLGKRGTPLHPRKSLAGSVAFFAAGTLAAWPFIGAPAAAYALVLAVVEGIEWGVDDNIVLPIAAIALHALATAIV